MVAPTTTRIPAATNGATTAPLPLPTLPLTPECDPKWLYIAYPPNEEPMADPIRLQDHLLAMLVPLVTFFNKIKSAFVFHNVFLYYRDGDVVRAVAPDLMIAFDIDINALNVSNSYHIWATGKPPSFVLEVGSDSTAGRDLNEKRGIYAKIGVREYWLTDPPDGARYGFILKGLRLVNGEYVEIPMVEGPDGNIRGRSEVLGLDICWENGTLRFYDPETGEYLRNKDDLIADLAERDAEIERLRALLAERNQS